MTPIYYTPHDLADEFGVSEQTARRALRIVAPRLGAFHETNQHWRFDLNRPLDRVTVDAARLRLQHGGRHSIRGNRHWSRKDAAKPREIAQAGRERV